VRVGVAGSRRRFELGRSRVRIGWLYGTHVSRVSLSGYELL
jgi:hypothetical protein